MNFTLAEFQQAKRLDMDPREVKQVFHQAFTQSDSAKAFKAALEDSGYYLARGDRRGMVAVDLHGKVYAVARWAGVKTKALREKFPDPGNLQTVEQTRSVIKNNLKSNMRGYMDEMRAQYKKEFAPIMAEKKALIANQRIERAKLKRAQTKRHRQESKNRAARYRTGFMGVYDLLTGKRRAIRKENEAHLARCKKRDLAEREALFHAQHKNRRSLQKRIAVYRRNEIAKRQALKRKMAEVLNITRDFRNETEKSYGLWPRDRSLDLSL